MAVSPPAAGFGSITVCTIPFSAQSPTGVRSVQGLQDWGWSCVCTEMPCFDEKAARGRQGGLFLQACLCCGCISPLFQSSEEHMDQYPNASAVQTGSASSRSSQRCGCCVYHVCSGGYTSSAVSALAASGRSKIIPHALGQCLSVVVTAPGGSSGCAVHMELAQQDHQGGSKQSRWAEK